MWDQLLQFCENDPKTPLNNKYMWSLYVQVRSCSGVVDVLKEVSLLTSHQDVFGDLHATHRQFIQQCVTNVMNSAGAAPSSMQEKQCVDCLTSMLRPLLANQGPALGNAGVTNQVPAMGNKAADQGAAHQGSAPDACAGAQAGLSLELLEELRGMMLLLAPQKEEMKGIIWVLDRWDSGGPQNRVVDLLQKFPGVGARVIEARHPTRHQECL